MIILFFDQGKTNKDHNVITSYTDLTNSKKSATKKPLKLSFYTRGYVQESPLISNTLLSFIGLNCSFK